ncbi:MAG: YybH family protein [Nitrospinaceae bacterium]
MTTRAGQQPLRAAAPRRCTPSSNPMTDQEAAQAANQGFYDAFNAQDLKRMQEVWQEGEQAVCIHPGWPVLKGSPAILKSWKDIFEHTDHMEIRLTRLTVLAAGEMAWISCQENLFSINPQGVQKSAVHATNLFRRQGGGWKMILHHAAAIPAHDTGNDPATG